MESAKKTFYFGAATSAHQVEGDTVNDWSAWEKLNAERLAEAARKRGNWPEHLIKAKPSPFEAANYVSGKAAAHYDRFDEDFKLAKELGHTAHRFSIEWSRIEPEEGEFDEKEIEHYRKVIKSLRAKGIEPFVTLWHWTNPTWLAHLGGPESQRFPFYFERYARLMVEKLGTDVSYWMTLNEPTSVIANSYMRGNWPPQKKSLLKACRVARNLAHAHIEGYRAIKEVEPNAHVGFGHIMTYMHPVGFDNTTGVKGVLNAGMAKLADFWSNRVFLELTGDWHDYMALQYYFVRHIDLFGKTAKPKSESDMGWEVYPEGLYHLLLSLKKYDRPVFVTENGIADARDAQRTDFIKTHLEQVKRAAAAGVDVRGYFHWSLLDNFEWDKGFWPRFGLIEVDYQTQKRTVRQSAKEFTKTVKEMFDGRI